MSGVVKLQGSGWPAEVLSPEAKDQHVVAATTRADTVAANGRAFRRAGWIVGGIGAAIGVIGIGAAMKMAADWTPSEPVVMTIDRSTGQMAPAMRAIEAPQSYTDGTVKQHLRLLVEACEGYHFDTRRVMHDRCLLFLSPATQEVYSRWFDVRNPKGPQAVLGRTGSAVPNNIDFTPLVRGANGTQVWNARYTRVERLPEGVVTCRPWLMTISFRWRPEVKFTAAEREINLGGMQAHEYQSQPDPALPPGCA